MNKSEKRSEERSETREEGKTRVFRGLGLGRWKRRKVRFGCPTTG